LTASIVGWPERGYFPWPTAKDGVAHLTQALAAEVAGWLKAAAADRNDDVSLDADQRGDDMPDWIVDNRSG